MKRWPVVVSGFVALWLMASPTLLANDHGNPTAAKIAGPVRFHCQARVVSVNLATDSLLVTVKGGSKTVRAGGGHHVTFRIGRRAELIEVAGQTMPLTLGEILPGAAVDLAGRYNRADTTARRYIVTKLILHRQLVWSDSFSGPRGAPPSPTKWQVATGGTGFGNNELEYYTARASNIALDGYGHLVINARREAFSGGGYTRDYTSAKIESKGRFAATYGSIQARIMIPAGRGLWPAFWALGNDFAKVGWPQSGEIDIMECQGQDPSIDYGSIHGPSSADPNNYTLTRSTRTASSLAERYHVYGVNWSPNLVRVTLDGKPYATYRPSLLSDGQKWAFNKRFFLVLNLAVGGDWPGGPDATTPFPARMVVDWVRVYS